MSDTSNPLTRFRKLPDTSRALLRSFLAYYIATPLIGMFTSAFLWENITSKLAVPFFHIGMYAGLCLGFYLTALCLRWVSVPTLYAIGLITQALPAFLLSLFPISSLHTVTVAGFSLGIFGGIYWGVRNLLTLQLIHNDHRDYFFGIDALFVVLSSTLLPVIMGFLIEYGFFLNGAVDSAGAFTVLIMMVIGILGLGARDILKAPLGSGAEPSALVRSSPKVWHKTRLLLFMFGAAIGGLVFIPPLLVLFQFKNQAELGTLQSLAAVISAMGVYRVGSAISTSRQRATGLVIGATILLMAAIPLLLGLNNWNVTLFVITGGFCFPFLWNCLNVSAFRSIELSDPERLNSFGYLCDREACLNSGRLVGALICLTIAHYKTIEVALVYAPVIGCCFFVLAALQLFRVAHEHEVLGPDCHDT